MSVFAAVCGSKQFQLKRCVFVAAISSTTTAVSATPVIGEAWTARSNSVKGNGFYIHEVSSYQQL